MSGQFCPKCGQPIYPGGSFCGFCATPIPAADTPPAPGTGPESAPQSAPPGVGSIGRLLDLGSVANFVLRQEGSGPAPRFAYTTPDHGPLLWLQPAASHPRFGVRLGHGLKFESGAGLGVAAQGRPWLLIGPAETPVGNLVFQHAGARGQATLYDVSEGEVLSARTEPQGWGGFRLTSTLADGTPYLQSAGKIRTGEQEYRDGSGALVARVHFPTISAHDRLFLDLVGAADAVGPLILAFFVHQLEP